MDGFKGFWGGVILAVLVIAAATRFDVPLVSNVANTVANKKT